MREDSSACVADYIQRQRHEPLMGFYGGIDREMAIREFSRQYFKASETFVLQVHPVGPPEKIQGTYETKLKLEAF